MTCTGRFHQHTPIRRVRRCRCRRGGRHFGYSSGAVVGMVGAGVYRSLIESMRALVTQGETVYPEAVYVRNAAARRKTYDEVRDSLTQRRV